MTIRNKLLLLIGSILIAIIAVYTTASYLAERHLLLQALDEKLLYSVEDVRGDLPADYHDRIVNSESVSPGDYAGIVNRNNNLCRTFGLQYLWSCMKIGDQVVFTTATSPSKDVAKRDYAPFLSVHSDPHAFDKAFETMKPVFGSFQNQWGHGRMILVPGRDRLGRPYCFGASVSVATIQSKLTQTLLHSLYLGIGFLLAGMVVSLLVSNSLAAPIVRLTEAADEIARGKMVQPIAAKGSTEILSLARSLEALDNSIRQKIGELESEITERKQAEEALRESEGRNRTILHSAMDGFCVVDARGRIQEVNPAFCQMNGYSEQELLCMKISNLETASPDVLEDRIRQVLARGGLCFESSHRHKDGHLLDLEISAKHQPSSGIIVCFHRDISERKKAKEILERRVAERTEELRRSEEQYRMLFEASRDAILTTDAGGNFLDCNRAALEMFGRADKDRFRALGPRGLSPEFQPNGRSSREAFAEVLTYLRGNESLFLEWQHQRADGTLFPVEVALSQFRVGNQTILLGMLRDISLRKEAEAVVLQNVARAEELARLKSRFVSMASHELRTPLANIMLACEL
ncbi:MAG: PAS domain S-box protein, partial [Terrimicrobiaceae bacterium]